MIPIRDDVPKYTTPYVNYFLVGLNVLVFLFEIALAPRNRDAFIMQMGIVPANVTGWLAGAPSVNLSSAFLPVFTSMFMHASWLHLIFNMWALWIFGDNVEDYLGHFSYLAFYLASGILATLAHIVFNLHSTVPSVGASGAIAGVMGAYFLLFPSARVLTLVPLFFFFFTWLPAWVVLGYWFVVQFLSGAATAIAYSHQTSGGVAFWAHVGGFVSGLLLIKIFPARPQRFSYD